MKAPQGERGRRGVTASSERPQGSAGRSTVTPLDVEHLRRVADRLAVLGYGEQASELVRGLAHHELAWLGAEFKRRADVCFEAAAVLEGTMRRWGGGGKWLWGY